MTRPGRPRSPERAEAQRERILDAAQRSFIDHGFHAATMNNIAELAGISAGLIYRYFESKQAIILAIIARELAQRRASIAQLHTCVDFGETFGAAFAELRNPASAGRSAPLFLETSAEATRAPKVAEAVRESDATAMADFTGWLRRSKAQGGRGLQGEHANDVALVLQLLFEGLAVRAARQPALSPARLRRAIARLAAALT